MSIAKTTLGLRQSRLYFGLALVAAVCLSPSAVAQATPLSWAEVRDKFEAANPTMQAARIGIDESRQQEVTAFLRPNPNVTGTIDQINPFTPQPSPSGNGGNSYSPFAFALPSGSIDYLHERQHKRELRRDSATSTAGAGWARRSWCS